VRADRGREHDERLRRRLEIVVEAALANQEVDDPRKLRVDRNHFRTIGAPATGCDPNDRDVLRQVGRDRGVALDHHHVRRVVRVREVEPRQEELLDVFAQGGVGDRDPRDEALAGSAVDRTTEPWGPRVARLTEHRVDPREELRGLEGLGDVIGSAAREPAHLVHDLAARGQEDHRDRRGRRVALDPKTDIVAVGVRKHHVEEHEVRQKLFDELDATPPVVGHRHHHAVRLEAALEHVGGRLVVFDDDHAGRRGVRADRFFYGFHCFFVFFVPSVSPRSQRIATMNFDGRSSRVFSLR